MIFIPQASELVHVCSNALKETIHWDRGSPGHPIPVGHHGTPSHLVPSATAAQSILLPETLGIQRHSCAIEFAQFYICPGCDFMQVLEQRIAFGICVLLGGVHDVLSCSMHHKIFDVMAVFLHRLIVYLRVEY